MIDPFPPPNPKPAPESVILYGLRAMGEFFHNAVWMVSLVGALILCEYFWKCGCGHSPVQHDREWPRGCRVCACKSLAR